MDDFEKVDKGIIKWNIDRGNTSWDLNLEMILLLEEAQEYFVANNLIDKFDAFLDYLFVGQGSIWKYEVNKIDNHMFDEFVETTGGILWNDFELQLKRRLFPMNHFFNFINDGLEIVLKYNNKKSAMKDANGKIVKPENFVGPEKELEALFNKYMKRGN